jgi:hypothetical protein
MVCSASQTTQLLSLKIGYRRKIANDVSLLSVSLYTLKTRILDVYLRIDSFFQAIFITQARAINAQIVSVYIWSYPTKTWVSIR